MTSLGDLQNSKGIQAVARFCPTSAEFLELVNSADKRLGRRGDWSQTVIPIYVCVFQGCVVWPRYVGQVRKMNICNRVVPMQNLWYSFMTGVNGVSMGGLGGPFGYGARGWDSYASWRGGHCRGLKQLGTSPVLQDAMGDGRTVRAYARCPQDYGKTMTIFGTDNNGQPLQTNNGDGTYSMGVQIVLQSPFGSTNTFVRHIDYVIRDATQQIVDCYYYNATTNLLEDMAHYEPSETEPSYAKTQLTDWPYTSFNSGVATPSCCSGLRGVLALVKLKHIDASAPTDLMLIDNIDAFQKEIQAIVAERAGDLVKAEAFQAAAVRELNRQLEDDSPDDNFSVENNVFGGSIFQNKCF